MNLSLGNLKNDIIENIKDIIRIKEEKDLRILLKIFLNLNFGEKSNKPETKGIILTVRG